MQHTLATLNIRLARIEFLDNAAPPAARRSRKRAAPETGEEAREATSSVETVMEALAGGREPRAVQGSSIVTLERAAA